MIAFYIHVKHFPTFFLRYLLPLYVVKTIIVTTFSWLAAENNCHTLSPCIVSCQFIVCLGYTDVPVSDTTILLCV